MWPFVISSRGACTTEVDLSIPKAGSSRRGRAHARIRMSIALHKARYDIIKTWATRQRTAASYRPPAPTALPSTQGSPMEM